MIHHQVRAEMYELRTLLTFLGILCLISVPFSALAQNSDGAQSGVEQQTGKIWIDEKTGAVLPLESEFFDENGKRVSLDSLIDRPTILLPIYFYCPNSCSTNLANLAAAMNRMKMEPGKDYRAIALSFNEKDTPGDARDAKANYLNILYDDFPAHEWSFITGTSANISKVLDTIGYTFKALDDGTFIHPSALITVAENGMIIKYVYGSFIPGDVEMALSEAKSGTPAISVKRLLNFCFNYDPSKNRSVFQTVKVIVLLVFGGLACFFFVRFIRKRDTKPI